MDAGVAPERQRAVADEHVARQRFLKTFLRFSDVPETLRQAAEDYLEAVQRVRALALMERRTGD